MNAIAINTEMAAVERALIAGDLGRLTADQRIVYYRSVCDSVGLNPLTQPFQYIVLEGKLQLYATKSCAEQLRKIHGVSTKVLSRETENGVHTVHVAATTADGREDEDIGSVSLVQPEQIKGKVGGYVPNPNAGQMVSPAELANLMMKAITKGKRRVTLSVCGLAMLDETQIEDMTAAPAVSERVTPLTAVETAPDVFSDDVPSADMESIPVVDTAPAPAAESPVEAKTWWPAGDVAADIVTAIQESAGPGSGAPACSLPAKLAVMAANIVAAKAEPTVEPVVEPVMEPAPVAKVEKPLTPAELTIQIMQTIMNISKPDRVDGTLDIFKARPGWSDLSELQLTQIETAAMIMKSKPERKRRATS